MTTVCATAGAKQAELLGTVAPETNSETVGANRFVVDVHVAPTTVTGPTVTTGGKACAALVHVAPPIVTDPAPRLGRSTADVDCTVPVTIVTAPGVSAGANSCIVEARAAVLMKRVGATTGGKSELPLLIVAPVSSVATVGTNSCVAGDHVGVPIATPPVETNSGNICTLEASVAPPIVTGPTLTEGTRARAADAIAAVVTKLCARTETANVCAVDARVPVVTFIASVGAAALLPGPTAAVVTNCVGLTVGAKV